MSLLSLKKNITQKKMTPESSGLRIITLELACKFDPIVQGKVHEISYFPRPLFSLRKIYHHHYLCKERDILVKIRLKILWARGNGSGSRLEFKQMQSSLSLSITLVPSWG